MVIERSIFIDAAPDKVWRVFTDPVVTRTMGGEYVSNWKTGGFFGWKGTDGRLYTHGKILAIEPGRLLKHKLFSREDQSILISVITYTLEYLNGCTVLLAKEELTVPVDKEGMTDTIAGWDSALFALKQVAENL